MKNTDKNTQKTSEGVFYDFNLTNDEQYFILSSIANNLQKVSFDLGRATVANHELAPSLVQHADANLRLLVSLISSFISLPEGGYTKLSEPAILMIREIFSGHMKMQEHMEEQALAEGEADAAVKISDQRKLFLDLRTKIAYDGVEADEKTLDDRAQAARARAESRIIIPNDSPSNQGEGGIII
jgi:hypothetical protein